MGFYIRQHSWLARQFIHWDDAGHFGKFEEDAPVTPV